MYTIQTHRRYNGKPNISSTRNKQVKEKKEKTTRRKYQLLRPFTPQSIERETANVRIGPSIEVITLAFMFNRIIIMIIILV